MRISIEEFACERAYCKIGVCYENQLYSISTSLEMNCHVFMLIQRSNAKLMATMYKATFPTL